MKKIFTFIAATLLAAGAYAQTLWAPNAETSVEANQTYIDNEVLTMKSTFAGTLTASELTIAGKDFTHFITVRVDKAPTADVPDGTVKDKNTSLIITANKDVTVTFYYRRQPADNVYASNDGKDLKVTNRADMALLDGTIVKDHETEKGDFAWVTKEYSLEAGKSYTVWGRGTTIQLSGIEYKAPTPATDPNDYTSYIVNADLTGNDGWNTEGTKGYHSVGGVVTAGNNAVFDFCQTIKNLPAGKYKMTAQAAYRYSSSEADEAAAIIAGNIDTKLATLYATVGTKTVSEKVMNRWDGASDIDYAEGSGSVTVNEKYVPNSTAAMKAWFAKGCYVNELEFNVVEDTDVTIGIVKTAQPEAGDYTVIGPWTLTRIGDAEQAPSLDGKLVISKIYYGRSKNKADNKNYSWGQFVEIYNNSAEPVNVAGLKFGIVEADAKSLGWTIDRMAEAHPDSIAIRQVFQIPGEEKILEPGKCLLLVNSAIDHSNISDFECDLTGADYEAKDAQKKYPNNDAVPALDMPYTYIATITYMLLPQTGACSMVLFTTDTDVTTLPTVFQYGKEKGNTNIIIPKSWVFEGVEIVSGQAAQQPAESQKRLYEDIDAGYQIAATGGFTGERFYRKTASVTADGRIVLQDTNNSSADFKASTTIQPREYDSNPSTGIQTVNATNVENKGIFNLQGQRMTQVQKGLYIVNGKKMMVK